ncbi:hypothetical protein CB0940_04985 [Cercospora beticola]|uniref:Uncharacterized protein n=1 Tax=Cercospora beticola TaxID=122368 RepID=A0A2G5HKX2_CERBT|nr:hypothetical protein CB0940_04985 [Cercospora beticola]PIA93180.1 hypothetical protein CB0940_04985 [Cercospora beticola]WPB02273.1 hypothetical protein RHO25_006907 [Cercospora beticola]CAK1362857.1 unnamed protein product [Cercospora beticola]
MWTTNKYDLKADTQVGAINTNSGLRKRYNEALGSPASSVLPRYRANTKLAHKHKSSPFTKYHLAQALEYDDNSSTLTQEQSLVSPQSQGTMVVTNPSKTLLVLLCLLLLPLQSNAINTGVDLCFYPKSHLDPCSPLQLSYCCNDVTPNFCCTNTRGPRWCGTMEARNLQNNHQMVNFFKADQCVRGNFDSCSMADTHDSRCCSKNWWQYPRMELGAEMQECSIRLETAREDGTVPEHFDYGDTTDSELSSSRPGSSGGPPGPPGSPVGAAARPFVNGYHPNNGMPYMNGGRYGAQSGGVAVESGTTKKNGTESMKGQTKRDEEMKCGTPTLLRYRNGDGKEQEILFKDENFDRLVDLIEARDWKALAKYHNGRPRL